MFGWALVGAGILAGCAGVPPPREAGQPVSRYEQEQLIARLQRREGTVRSLRGTATVGVTVNGETRRLREAMALRSDGRFRLETLGAFGMPVLIIASDGKEVAVHGNPEVAGGSPGGCGVLRYLLGVNLSPPAFVRLLLGFPPRPIGPSAFVSYLQTRQAYLLEEEYGDVVQRLYLGSSGAVLGGAIWEGRRGLRFVFDGVRRVEGIAVPAGITLTQVHRPVRVTVSYRAVDINPVLADRLFVFPASTPALAGGC
ncbi:MAG: hypothetical protein ACE5IQ_07170 [Candidatus Methylomirabilales bacterium]